MVVEQKIKKKNNKNHILYKTKINGAQIKNANGKT